MTNTILQNAHIFVKSLFFSIVAELKNFDDIEYLVRDYFPVEKFYRLQNDTDLAFIAHIGRDMHIGISGTRNPKGWVRNFNALAVHGWHRGFHNSFDQILLEPMQCILSQLPGKIYIHGHSAGPAIGLNAAHYIRTTFSNRSCELIGFCSPQAVNEDGARQCRKAKVCSTVINVGKYDIVDNIAEVASKIIPLIGGVTYGTEHMLPDIGRPNINEYLIIDGVFMGHSPSYVCKCLKELFKIWKKPQDEAIDKIIQYATK